MAGISGPKTPATLTTLRLRSVLESGAQADARYQVNAILVLPRIPPQRLGAATPGPGLTGSK